MYIQNELVCENGGIDLAKACINLKSEEIGNKKSNKESVKIFPMKSKTTKKSSEILL